MENQTQNKPLDTAGRANVPVCPEKIRDSEAEQLKKAKAAIWHIINRIAESSKRQQRLAERDEDQSGELAYHFIATEGLNKLCRAGASLSSYSFAEVVSHATATPIDKLPAWYTEDES
jgi:hypothetical protein